MKKLPLILGLLVAAGFAAEANAQFIFSNPGALNAGINVSHQGAASGGVGQTVGATQIAGATVNHIGGNTIGQTSVATNDPATQVGSGVSSNFGSVGDSASAANELNAIAKSGSVSNTAGQANIGGAFGGLITAQ